jgi:hypothetical protein
MKPLSVSTIPSWTTLRESTSDRYTQKAISDCSQKEKVITEMDQLTKQLTEQFTDLETDLGKEEL